MSKAISLKEKIVIFLKGRYPNWTLAGQIEIFASSEGRMYSNAKRRAQELAQDGKIERRINNGLAEYRYKPTEEENKVNWRPEVVRQRQMESLKLL